MILHLHRVKVVEEELRDALDNDGVEPVEKRLGGLNSRLTLNVIGREQVVTNEHVSGKDALKLLFLGVHDPELLEGLQTARAVSTTASAETHHLHSSCKVFLFLNVFGTSSGSTRSSCL